MGLLSLNLVIVSAAGSELATHHFQVPTHLSVRIKNCESRKLVNFWGFEFLNKNFFAVLGA